MVVDVTGATIDATREQVRAVAHLLGLLHAGVATADEAHLGYVRMTMPVAHAKPAAGLLEQMLGIARDGVMGRD